MDTSSLVRGDTKSCGCLSAELASERRIKEGTMKIGQKFLANSGGEFEVIEYINCDKVKVRFLLNRNITFASAGNIRKGEVLDVYYKSVYNTGYIGEGIFTKDNYPIAYSHWSHMIGRCYSSNFGDTYRDCTVLDDWHNFQNFALWYSMNKKDFKCALDKDILKKGNRLYCPEYCELVPPSLNSFLCKANSIRGNLPIGVVERNTDNYTKYIAQIYYKGKHEYLGLYDTIEEAFKTYKNRKEDIAKELAEYYFELGSISTEMRDSLYSYEVEVTD